MAAKPKPASSTAKERGHFAARLRTWRTGRGLMLKEVADAFGVAEATWSRWEKQQRFPSPANLRLLAEFIGVPICCFFYPTPAHVPTAREIKRINPDPMSCLSVTCGPRARWEREFQTRLPMEC